MAHLGSSMQRCHPIIGSNARIRSTVFDQVLNNLQMAFLAGQVEWCGTIFCLGVDKAVGKWISKENERLLHNKKNKNQIGDNTDL